MFTKNDKSKNQASIMAQTLGRRKSKDKKKKKEFHNSCQSLAIDDDKIGKRESRTPRPDSGYDDSYLGQASFLQEKDAIQSALVDLPKLKSDPKEDAMRKVTELIQSEKNYIDKLRNINSFYTYMEASKTKTASDDKRYLPMPADLSGGKDRIIFANSRALLGYHQGIILPELEKIKTVEDIHRLQDLFRYRKDVMKEKYGKFCINVPKAEFIYAEFEDYFRGVKLALDLDDPLNNLFMEPFQRVTRYRLILGDIAKRVKKTDDQFLIGSINEACRLAKEICESANEMMLAGRMVGFPGSITRQGLLVTKGDVICYKKKKTRFLKKPKMLDCIMFIFMETIVICYKTPVLFQMDSAFPKPPELTYWVSYKMNRVKIQNHKSDGTCFELDDNGLPKRGGEADVAKDFPIMVKCESEAGREEWLQKINNQIHQLRQVALDLQNPQANARLS